MRLIDADKLLPKLWVCYEENKPIVDAEPTVKAIPIELIKKKLLSCQYEYENDYDKGFDKGWNCAIKTLLKDWEKENETDRCG